MMMMMTISSTDTKGFDAVDDRSRNTKRCLGLSAPKWLDKHDVHAWIHGPRCFEIWGFENGAQKPLVHDLACGWESVITAFLVSATSSSRPSAHPFIPVASGLSADLGAECPKEKRIWPLLAVIGSGFW